MHWLWPIKYMQALCKQCNSLECICLVQTYQIKLSCFFSHIKLFCALKMVVQCENKRKWTRSLLQESDISNSVSNWTELFQSMQEQGTALVQKKTTIAGEQKKRSVDSFGFVNSPTHCSGMARWLAYCFLCILPWMIALAHFSLCWGGSLVGAVAGMWRQTTQWKVFCCG